jgi:stage V sporulation protein G
MHHWKDYKKNYRPCKRKVVKILDITDIRVKKILTDGVSESKMKAVVSVTFDDSFVVHDIKIIEGQDKLFTAMPSRKTQEGEFKDIAHPINRQMRLKLEEAILAEYQNVLAQTAEE